MKSGALHWYCAPTARELLRYQGCVDPVRFARELVRRGYACAACGRLLAPGGACECPGAQTGRAVMAENPPR